MNFQSPQFPEGPEFDPNQPRAARPATEGEIVWRLISRLWQTPIRVVRQWLCGKIHGHRPLSRDTGWLIGSTMVDKWCSRCGKMVQIPKAEDPHYD